MPLNTSRFRWPQHFKDCFTPALAIIVASGLICIAAGSLKAGKDLGRSQAAIAQDVDLQQLITEIIYHREMLSVSARAAATTGDLDWQGRYEAYERMMIAAIAQMESATSEAPTATLPSADIKAGILNLVETENQAFALMQAASPQQALALLSSESYQANQEVNAANMQQWLQLLTQRLQLETARQDRAWIFSNSLVDAGIVLLTIAWGALLAQIGYYTLLRKKAEKDTYRTKQQMVAHAQAVDTFKSALLKKQTALEDTLSELQQTKDQLAVSHQDVQVSKAALSQKAATLEEIIDELQVTKFKLAVSHKELQVSKAALSQKAATLETILEELQQTQIQMVQSEKMSSLGQLVAGIAHEINNPVNFIYANLEPVQAYMNDLLTLIEAYRQACPQPSLALHAKIEAADLDFVKEDFPKVLESMAVGTERIQQIVLSLQNFSRSDESGLKPANIHDGLESTLLILQHRLNARPGYSQIEVVCEYGDIPAVECYPGLINQVFMNLISNAIDALDELYEERQDSDRGAITLRTSVLEKAGVQWVEVAIADTGIGVPEEIQGRIFDAFFTTKPVGKGTGMGLSISHTVVTKKHGGQLTFFSRPNEGAEFIVQLPVQVEAAAVETPPAFILQPPMATASVRGQAAQFVL